VASAAAIAVASTTADATEAVVPAVGEDENHLSPGYLALADLLGLSTSPAFHLLFLNIHLIIAVILIILILSFYMER
jgi:hypothetical protein